MSRVLVVEDEAHLAQGLRFNLQAEGYSAEVVGDGEAATERLSIRKKTSTPSCSTSCCRAKMASAWFRNCARRGIMCRC
jgi:CheY-like chemotaxis protein